MALGEPVSVHSCSAKRGRCIGKTLSTVDVDKTSARILTNARVGHFRASQGRCSRHAGVSSQKRLRSGPWHQRVSGGRHQDNYKRKSSCCSLPIARFRDLLSCACHSFSCACYQTSPIVIRCNNSTRHVSLIHIGRLTMAVSGRLSLE